MIKKNLVLFGVLALCFTSIAGVTDAVEDAKADPENPAEKALETDALPIETADGGDADTIPDAGKTAENPIDSSQIEVPNNAPCDLSGFKLPELTPVEDAACFFAKNGWFPKDASSLDLTALLAELTKLLGSDASSVTPALGVGLLQKCYKYFQPPPLDSLKENCGGECGKLFGGDQGYDIDLFDVPKKCSAVVSSLVNVRTGGVEAPLPVVKLCLSYFKDVVVDRIFKAFM